MTTTSRFARMRERDNDLINELADALSRVTEAFDNVLLHHGKNMTPEDVSSRLQILADCRNALRHFDDERA